MDTFRLTAGSHSAAMDYIVGHLTEAQRLVLVTSKVSADKDASIVPVYGNENTLKSLMNSPAPLVVDGQGRIRQLSPLGMDVARYLLTTGNYHVPPTIMPVPSFLTPVNV
jgi:hypothetical protein